VADSQTFSNVLQTIPLTARRTAGSNYRTEPGDFIARAVVTNLTSDQLYYYRFVGPNGLSSPIGTFRTLPDEGSSRPLKFLHISCANEPPFPIGAALLQESADSDFIVFNGDTVYADRFWLDLLPTESLDFYRSLYRDQRNPEYAGSEFPQLFARIAFVINWDDHEVIDNYSGQAASGGTASQLNDSTGETTDVEDLKVLGYQAFFEYNPITPNLTEVGGVNSQDRLFRSFRYGADAEVFVLDLRQYRDQAVATPILPILPTGLTPELFLQLSGLTALTPEQQAALFGPPGTEDLWPQLLRQTPRNLLGGPQKNWLLEGLARSTATYKFIVSEYPISLTFFRSNDVWEGYWLERQEVLEFIQGNGIGNVVFLTGNNHAGFIGRVNPGLDPAIWEVWTGPTGLSVTAISLEEEAAALGFEGGAELYYGAVNAFLAPEAAGGIPGVTLNSLFFLEIATPNYTTIEISGGQATLRIKDPAGQVIVDPLGRPGELILPQG
jgi:alkaline phosphatase D